MSADLPNNPYRSPAAAPPGEQATSEQTRSGRLGAGYFAILFLNFVGLLGGAFVLSLGLNDDGYAALGALVIGAPLFAIQLFLSCLPAVIYTSRNAALMGKMAIVFAVATPIASMGLTAGGLLVAMVLPHGGGC
jgi:hypothetical protein